MPPEPPISTGEATTLITAAELRELFAVVSQIGDPRLEFAIRGASRTLRKWVGDEAYEDALVWVNGDEAQDETRAAALKDAEAYSAAAELLLNTSLRIRASGLVKREQDAAGPLGGQITNEYLSPKEIRELREEYAAQAEAIAAPYRPLTTASGASVGRGTFTLAGGWRSDGGMRNAEFGLDELGGAGGW